VRLYLFYKSNLDSANKLVLEASPIASILRLVCRSGKWNGTASKLLHDLDGRAGDERYMKEWPKNPQQLSIELRRLAPNLRPGGLNIQLDQKTAGANSRRMITITMRKPGLFEENVQSSAQIRRFPRIPQRFPRE
jgi:hypothetical protein